MIVNVHKRSLLGKEGFESFKEATHSQSVSQSDTAIHSSTGQAKQLANRVAQLFHTINYFSMFLTSGDNMECVKYKGGTKTKSKNQFECEVYYQRYSTNLDEKVSFLQISIL